MKSLIAALADIGVSEEMILDIRRIVEPSLAPIAVALGLGRPAPEPKPKKQTSKAEAELQAPSEPQTPEEFPLVSPAPVGATPITKRRRRVPTGKSGAKSARYKARKLWAQQNYIRRKKGLEPLPKPAILLSESAKEKLQATLLPEAEPMT
jgi:hypothetical protein